MMKKLCGNLLLFIAMVFTASNADARQPIILLILSEDTFAPKTALD